MVKIARFYMDYLGGGGRTVTALTTDYVTLANEANSLAVGGILPGVYNPTYNQLQQEIEAWRKSLNAGTEEGR